MDHPHVKSFQSRFLPDQHGDPADFQSVAIIETDLVVDAGAKGYDAIKFNSLAAAVQEYLAGNKYVEGAYIEQQDTPFISQCVKIRRA
jgi:hypothetical protein